MIMNVVAILLFCLMVFLMFFIPLGIYRSFHKAVLREKEKRDKEIELLDAQIRYYNNKNE